MAAFGLNEVQATAAVDLQVRRFDRAERHRIAAEQQSIRARLETSGCSLSSRPVSRSTPCGTTSETTGSGRQRRPSWRFSPGGCWDGSALALRFALAEAPIAGH